VLCPRCGAEEYDPDTESFCEPCERERAAARYLEGDTEQVEARRTAWRRTVTADRLNAAERQRRKKLKKLLKPTQPVTEHDDPFLLAQTALHALRRLKMGTRRSTHVTQAIAEAEEAIKQLAWGPERN
jgi:uncharacterized Zn finger protein (UPF0148 family)